MKFLLSPDSFKESMSAQEACDAMERGILSVLPFASCWKIPMADGGEGTLNILRNAINGILYRAEVTGPLGDAILAEYAISGDGKTGLVELASASGLDLVPHDQRNPMVTTTYGTGELINILLKKGINKLIIGIGGSATNDGGVGIAQALGAKFLDKFGKPVGFGGGELSKIDQIDASQLAAMVANIDIEVACDVNNTLTGADGASMVYGPQKGASRDMAMILDENMRHYAKKLKEATGQDVEFLPGGGAAGGTGAGLMALLNARLVKGIDLVIDYSGIAEKIKEADYIFTGEGSIDKQTINGKTLSGLSRLAKRHGVPVIAFAGRVKDNADLYELGITSVFGILPEVCGEKDALALGSRNLERTVSAVTRVLALK